jgi:hypothetical protein
MKIPLEKIIPLINKKWLFLGLWKLKGRKAEGEKILAGLLKRSGEFGIKPKIIYKGTFKNVIPKDKNVIPKDKNVIPKDKNVIPKDKNVIPTKVGIQQPRKILDSGLRRNDGNRCAFAGFTLMAATIGAGIKKVADKKYRAGEYADYFYITGLASALAEALTEYGHKLVCKRFKCNYAKTYRISPGYPAWPDLSAQRKIARVLKMKKIGITLSRTYQLVPEHSTTSAIFLV